jgi:tRNA(Ile)-lysidine synthase
VSGLVESVENFWIALEPGAAVVAAVSGGPDSVALLHALVRLTDNGSVERVVVGHVNHQLRGADSDADEAFVAALCESLHGEGRPVEYRATRLTVADQPGNLEANARQQRYRWLEEIAHSAGVGFVATGHTADDQAETVLHRLMRGSGITGLCGIPRRRPLGEGVELVRPLLASRRAEVLAYLAENSYPYREDRSNADRAFTRNRIRHHLLPLLAAEYNPGVVDVLNRLSRQAEELLQTEEEETRRLLEAAELQRAGATLVFGRRQLAGAPRHRVRELFRAVWRREGWPMGDMGYEHWERLTAVARGEATAVDLPHGVSSRCREIVVQLVRTTGE